MNNNVLQRLEQVAMEMEKILADSRHPRNSIEILEAYKKLKEMCFWTNMALTIKPVVNVKFNENKKKANVVEKNTQE